MVILNYKTSGENTFYDGNVYYSAGSGPVLFDVQLSVVEERMALSPVVVNPGMAMLGSLEEVGQTKTK